MRDIGEDVSSCHTYTSTYVRYSGTEYVRTLYWYTALDLFTLDYSKLFSVPDRLLFNKFLTDNDKIPGMFMRLDSEERLLFIQESIDNNK